jgi:pimeloyl-ACP methyl ester carboxylesterase
VDAGDVKRRLGVEPGTDKRGSKDMFELFPGNYSLSQAVNMGIRAGLQVGEVVRAVGPLAQQDRVGMDELYFAWSRFAEQQVDLASEERDKGFLISAGERLMRAGTAQYVAQVRIQTPELKLQALKAHWANFSEGVRLSGIGYERVEFDSDDGLTAAWWMPGSLTGSAPAVIFYPGFDLDKDMLVPTVANSFQRRGIGVLIVDGPGIGEALWLHDVPSRPDYEVPARDALNYLRTRSDVVGDKVGVVGISLGGYYAARAAAFEPELACCVAWGAVKDFGANQRRRWLATGEEPPGAANSQIVRVMGTPDYASAMERVKEWNLVGKLGGLTQPFLLVHGELDRATSMADAKYVFREVPAKQKELRVFTAGEGGAEHCQIDEPLAARDYIADWVGSVLGPDSSK